MFELNTLFILSIKVNNRYINILLSRNWVNKIYLALSKHWSRLFVVVLSRHPVYAKSTEIINLKRVTEHQICNRTYAPPCKLGQYIGGISFPRNGQILSSDILWSHTAWISEVQQHMCLCHLCYKWHCRHKFNNGYNSVGKVEILTKLEYR